MLAGHHKFFYLLRPLNFFEIFLTFFDGIFQLFFLALYLFYDEIFLGSAAGLFDDVCEA
jgi:hypothetical protein